jgi:phage/plasmid-associated DNA primase
MFSELFGKMINVSGETPTKKCMNTDLVKSVVAGDWVTGREVYKKPSKFKPYAKHYLGMNTLPDIEDNTHGMWRRIHVIEFPRKFAEHEMDVELTEKLMAELSGIFNWALEGYKRLVARNLYSVKALPCLNRKNNTSKKATAFWILLIVVLKMLILKTLLHLKICINVILAFV